MSDRNFEWWIGLVVAEKYSEACSSREAARILTEIADAIDAGAST